MNILYFEDTATHHLLPLTWLRAPFELLCGRDRLIDKVRRHVGPRVVRLLLRELVTPVVGGRTALDEVDPGVEWCLLNARVLITGHTQLPAPGVCWRQGEQVVAIGIARDDVDRLPRDLCENADALAALRARCSEETPPPQVSLVRYPWEPALLNEQLLLRELAGGRMRPGGPAAPGVHLVHAERIHIDPSARIKPGAVLDADEGPIHVGAETLVESNAVIQGPCYVGPRSIVRPGTVLRGGVTIGPVCKVGGEIEASIILGYSNKQHDGFLGHSYVGAWVNLGADTITSDLKNTYGLVRVDLNGVSTDTGQQLVGSIIGDHAKTGIGTILPTGCIVGVAANVFTRETVPKFVPSFAWMADGQLERCRTDKAVEIARAVMGRRDITLSADEEQLLRRVAEAARQVEAPGWA